MMVNDRGDLIQIAALTHVNVKPNEAVLLALNSRGIPHAPFGALAIGIDRQPRKAVKTYRQYRPELLKANRAPVSTMPFLDSAYAMFTGVIHSSVDCAIVPTS